MRRPHKRSRRWVRAARSMMLVDPARQIVIQHDDATTRWPVNKGVIIKGDFVSNREAWRWAWAARRRSGTIARQDVRRHERRREAVAQSTVPAHHQPVAVEPEGHHVMLPPRDPPCRPRAP